MAALQKTQLFVFMDTRWQHQKTRLKFIGNNFYFKLESYEMFNKWVVGANLLYDSKNTLYSICGINMFFATFVARMINVWICYLQV